jgi:hypothetical protein
MAFFFAVLPMLKKVIDFFAPILVMVLFFLIGYIILTL